MPLLRDEYFFHVLLAPLVVRRLVVGNERRALAPAERRAIWLRSLAPPPPPLNRVLSVACKLDAWLNRFQWAKRLPGSSLIFAAGSK
jgi:hypothetical protein